MARDAKEGGGVCVGRADGVQQQGAPTHPHIPDPLPLFKVPPPAPVRLLSKRFGPQTVAPTRARLLRPWDARPDVPKRRLEPIVIRGALAALSQVLHRFHIAYTPQHPGQGAPAALTTMDSNTKSLTSQIGAAGARNCRWAPGRVGGAPPPGLGVRGGKHGSGSALRVVGAGLGLSRARQSFQPGLPGRGGANQPEAHGLLCGAKQCTS